MELADMNSLGLFDFISYPFKSDLPYTLSDSYNNSNTRNIIARIVQLDRTLISCINNENSNFSSG